MQPSLQLEPRFEQPSLRASWRPKLVIWAIYPGISEPLRSKNFYDPRLDGALRTILDDIQVHVGDVALIRCENERSRARGEVAIVTRQEGRRWPLAFLRTHVGELDFDALQRAWATIGGRP